MGLPACPRTMQARLREEVRILSVPAASAGSLQAHALQLEAELEKVYAREPCASSLQSCRADVLAK
jgi:hypothetical protein